MAKNLEPTIVDDARDIPGSYSDTARKDYNIDENEIDRVDLEDNAGEPMSPPTIPVNQADESDIEGLPNEGA